MIHYIAKPLKGKKAALLGEIKRRTEEASEPYTFHVTTRKGEARELAASVTEEDGQTIVVVGGDGTLNDALMGIADLKKCTLGLIPAGTGNDFAAAAGIPYGAGALDLILGGVPRETDVICFSDGKRSLNIAGLGIDVDILLRCERRKFFHARSKYFLSLLSSLLHYRGMGMQVFADGNKLAEGKMLLAAICNGSKFGGGIPICPPARIGDGKLGLVYVDCPSRRKIPFALIKLMKGEVLSLPFAHYAECGEAELVPAVPFTAQYDGELFAAERFCAHIESGLKMFRGGNESL